MDIKLRGGEAAYLEIADHITTQVALRRLRPGERLPSIRELAQRLQLDPGTVARAYRELERGGIITCRRGGGSFISAADQKPLAEEHRKRLALVVEKAILEALGMGFTIEDMEAAFTLHLANWRERRKPSVRQKGKAYGRGGRDIRFLGSHDLAVELLASHLGTLHPPLHFAARFVGSLAGLVALECGEADIAGMHLLDEDSGEFNIPFVKRLMPHETVVLMNLVQRIQGLMVGPGNPKHILGVEDLRRPDITFVNRQKGSGTRLLLDSRLLRLGISPAEVKGYQREERTHLAVAFLVAQGHADVGLGAQSAASIAGLDFIPLLKERYDLVSTQERFSQPPFRMLQEEVGSEGFRGMLRSIPGYDVSQTGNIITVSPK